MVRLIHYETHTPNFGDDLNAVLWPALAPRMFDGDGHEGFVGIGTIIGLDPGVARVLHIFSSGAGYSTFAAWQGVEQHYHCVRGPVTARLLGLEADKVLTDGAILTPLAAPFPAAASGEGGVAIIPHFETLAFPGWDKVVEQTGFAVIDPRHSPAQVIGQIAAARLVLAESLHGAILADTYGVPWLPFATSRNFSMTKWADWTASIGVDLAVTLVPPPDPQPLLKFGRRPEPFGSVIRMDAAQAIREFEVRMAGEVRRNWVKERLKQVPALRRFMGFSPSRTAEALTALAAREPVLSEAPLRARLQQEMIGRLGALAAQRGASITTR